MADLQRTHGLPDRWRIGSKTGVYAIVNAHHRHHHCRRNVDPSGEQLLASVGQGVILNVKSDMDEELHAHVGLDGYVLRVWGGQTTTAGFRLRGPGSFVVESHRLRKTIVILNVS